MAQLVGCEEALHIAHDPTRPKGGKSISRKLRSTKADWERAEGSELPKRTPVTIRATPEPCFLAEELSETATSRTVSGSPYDLH